jgi:hypothetical protein
MRLLVDIVVEDGEERMVIERRGFFSPDHLRIRTYMCTHYLPRLALIIRKGHEHRVGQILMEGHGGAAVDAMIVVEIPGCCFGTTLLPME